MRSSRCESLFSDSRATARHPRSRAAHRGRCSARPSAGCWRAGTAGCRLAAWAGAGSTPSAHRSTRASSALTSSRASKRASISALVASAGIRPASGLAWSLPSPSNCAAQVITTGPSSLVIEASIACQAPSCGIRGSSVPSTCWTAAGKYRPSQRSYCSTILALTPRFGFGAQQRVPALGHLRQGVQAVLGQVEVHDLAREPQRVVGMAVVVARQLERDLIVGPLSERPGQFS